MLRLIKLEKQIDEETRRFAIWNTVSDMFLDYNGSQTWASWEQLEFDLDWSGWKEDIQLKERLKSLLPKWAL